METLLFTHEEIIARTDEDIVVLTTHRVRYAPSKSRITSFMLDTIVGIQLRYTSKMIFAWLSIAFLLTTVGGVLEEYRPAVVASAGMMILFLLLYIGSRKLTLKIVTAGLSMDIQLGSMRNEDILSFINHVEVARASLLLECQPLSNGKSLVDVLGSLKRDARCNAR